MTCITWNIEWASMATPRGDMIAKIVADADPDVVCFTETTRGMEPEYGYLIDSNPDYGYPNTGGKRKVALWSKSPWLEVDSVGSIDLPGGRFVSGVTEGICFVGVCIPWHDAHVSTGRKDRQRWQDHRLYLQGLKNVVQHYCSFTVPVCLLGDFNQRIPRSWQPKDMAEQLMDVMGVGLKLATAGLHDEEGQQLIDHIAVSGHLAVRIEKILPKSTGDGLHLSDHSGISFLLAPYGDNGG